MRDSQAVAERDAQARRSGGCNARQPATARAKKIDDQAAAMQPGDRRKRCSSEMVRRLQCETARRLQEQEKIDGQAAACGSQATTGA